MSRFSMLIQIFTNMGFRYASYRLLHFIKTKIGWYLLIFPKTVKPKVFLSYSEWLYQKKEFFFDNTRSLQIDSLLTDLEKQKISETAYKIKNGVFLFFNSEEFSLGVNYNWLTNPLNGYTYPSDLHWSKINDYDDKSGDIKYVWEKSRFSFLYSLIRDEEVNGNKHQEFIFSQISEWIDANPLNQGANWKCSQEISIRVLNWIFAIYYYSNKDQIKEDLWQKILNSIFQQMSHVRKHINFSRIAVRNNHALTETLALYLVGLLFPWLDKRGQWRKNGKKWFEQEIVYQVYEDGTFLQFSMNYHRVVIQLLTKAIVLSEVNGDSFPQVIYDRAYQSLTFLYQCQNLDNGLLPNYGANDGALFFPLNSCNYRDFRPQLGALHYVLTGFSLYSFGNWQEDTIWMVSNKKFFPKNFNRIEQKNGLVRFPKGGYYLIRDKDTLTFLRAGSHKDRPSQADNLHLDIWCKNENIFFDAGSFKYNDSNKELVRYFTGTKSHNTVMLNEYDQMLKGDRFMWFYWTQAIKIEFTEDHNYYIIDATVSAFRYLDKNCKHRRVIKKIKNNREWIIEDFIYSDVPYEMKQIWHTRKEYLEYIDLYSIGVNDEALTNIITQGWYSSLYGKREAVLQVSFSTNGMRIKTSISVKK